MSKAPIRRPAKGPKVAIAQIEPILGDVAANLEKHRDAVLRANEEQVDLLVFPELSLTGYRLKDTVPDVALLRGAPVFDELAGMSEQTSLVVGLVAETEAHSFYNSAAYFEDGKLLAFHHKAYLPTYGMFDEQRYFARGDQIRAFDSKHARSAMLVCEDMLHPSAATIAALDGAAILLVPSASPVKGVVGDDEESVDSNGRGWEEYNRAMARSLGLFVVHANRVGVEDGQTFWGGSEIIDPDGASLAKAAYYDPDFIAATLPLEALRQRRIQAPVLRDENIDLTINELCRIRGRSEPARPYDRDGGVRRGGAPPRYDRGGDDRRRDDRRDGRRDDRRDGRRDDRRDDRRGGGERRYGRDGDAPRYERRGDDRRQGGDRHYGDPPRTDRRGDDGRDSNEPRERNAPTRTRPDARARTPRPVGRSSRSGGDTEDS